MTSRLVAKNTGDDGLSTFDFHKPRTAILLASGCGAPALSGRINGIWNGVFVAIGKRTAGLIRIGLISLGTVGQRSR